MIEREEVVVQEGVETEMVGYRVPGAQLHYRLLWDQGDVRVALMGVLSRDELLRMARSMYPLTSY